jgi:hypothetical protein
MSNSNRSIPDFQGDKPAYYRWCVRTERRTILFSRLWLIVLWLPTKLGLPWAIKLSARRYERISHAKYGLEDALQMLDRLERYGTTIVGFLCFKPRRDDGDSYDNWLAPQDQYREPGQ